MVIALAKDGILKRGNVAGEIIDFSKVGNLIRSAIINKNAIIKIRNHYESLKCDVSDLIKENNDTENKKDQSDRDFQTEPLARL